MALLEIILLVIPFLLLVFCFSLLGMFIWGPPFVPTPHKVIKEALRLAEVSEGDTIIDLGSGDGRMLLAAAKKGATAKGWELNPFLVMWTIFVARQQRVEKQIQVFCKNYMTADMNDASVVFLYTFSKPMIALEKKLMTELKPGSKIISYKFTFPNLKPTKQLGDMSLYIIKQ